MQIGNSIRQLATHALSHQLFYGLVSLSVFVYLFLCLFNHQLILPKSLYVVQTQQLVPNYPPINSEASDKLFNYAVFSTNTPNGASYRSFDYAFNLPLTALAWERIGFRSIAIIIGSRYEWENDPALSHILSYTEARRATVIFINSPLEYRTALSQTSRLFVFNMKEFPGNDNDYLMTTDSDLWPLHKEHFIPRPHMNVVLVHSNCCGFFPMHGRSWPMLPMSNIGATVSTWKEAINGNHTFANDTVSILDYLENLFGERVRVPVVVAKQEWYMDQHLVSIRLTEWIDQHGNDSVYRVNDAGYYRLDRNGWNADILTPELFSYRFDTHLLKKAYLPQQWKLMQPLLNLMYGNDSWQVKWCNQYAAEFLDKVKNYMAFHEPPPDLG